MSEDESLLENLANISTIRHTPSVMPDSIALFSHAKINSDSGTDSGALALVIFAPDGVSANAKEMLDNFAVRRALSRSAQDRGSLCACPFRQVCSMGFAAAYFEAVVLGLISLVRARLVAHDLLPAAVLTPRANPAKRYCVSGVILSAVDPFYLPFTRFGSREIW